MAGLVKHVRQAETVRDVVESDGKGNAIMAAIKFPYIVTTSHA